MRLAQSPASTLTFLAAAALASAAFAGEPGVPSSLLAAAPAAEVRWITVPGTPVVAATWAQDGVPHYAISLDGKSFATVQETSYEILMRRARFDPLAWQPDFSGSLLPEGGDVHLVQFATQPLEAYTDAIAREGAKVYDYVANHAFIVRMAPEVAARVAELPFVRWVGPYHPEYRLEPWLLQNLDTGALFPSLRYNVQVFERGIGQKQIVAQRIAALGGRVNALIPDGFLLEATLTPAQLAQVVAMDEVSFVDRWGEPETDMDIVRTISGANYIETQTTFTGQGVRGECMDTGVLTSHSDFQHDGGVLIHAGNSGSTSHGTQVCGIVFGNGTGQAQGRGLLPNGKAIFAAYTAVANRYTHTAELVASPGAYEAVFQTNSWGDPQVLNYTNKSFEMDDIIFINDILITQSQSNTGTQLSRPQAWAKNIVSVGGITHNNTLTTADDSWTGASIGPAEDGRIKPDLAHFYDSVWAPASSGSYSNFSGTSSATPCTVGHFGLFFQLWHNDTFGPTAGATVFAARPHFTLAKAALINNGKSYSFTGSSANLSRYKQGWGLPDVQRLYDKRTKTFWINQTEAVDNLETVTYNLTVVAGEPDLKATLVYRDPAGTVSALQHRKNDLSLKVTSPSSTIYWGNNGLAAGNWSTSGGSGNTKDTVENVFVLNPAAGTWTVQVIGSDVNTDIRPEPGVNADFALWVTGGTVSGCSTPTIYCTSKVSSSFCSPSIAYAGTPSLAAAGSFSITTSQMEDNKNGLTFFGTTGSNGAPFQGGFLCAKSPTYRLATKNTGGAGTCQGSLAYTLADVVAHPSGGPLVTSGTQVNCQTWGRDPLDPFTTSLSDGLQFVVCP